jgi:hypothetical protein
MQKPFDYNDLLSRVQKQMIRSNQALAWKFIVYGL